MALYEGYQFVTRDSPHTWPLVRRLARYVFLHYPYFRLNVVVFEEREEAKEKKLENLQELEQEKDSNATTDDDDVDSDKSNDAGHLNNRALFVLHPHGVLTCDFSFNGAHRTTFQRAA
ncbi:hypothetical protein PHYPSEUDO_013251 [Phytophthora pseudosyringae]|uniref:Acyltransferase n=1 Tax=Phytophthora pseudosyringae TaxID=221518 RepID=A0A8T1W8F8_9STRA|nr:hypothetical protein PHYPSEUDO_013251 [Phytophthora pseudosyringae]